MEVNFQNTVDILDFEASQASLGRVSFGEQKASSLFKSRERTEYIGGKQVATNTKKMIERVLGLDLYSEQDDWLELNNLDQMDLNLDILKKQGYSFVASSLSPLYRKKINASLGSEINIGYSQVDTITALQEIGNISFSSEKDNRLFQEIQDLLRKIWNFNTSQDDGNINMQELQELITDFHFFALQYHHDSYKEKSEDERKIFTAALEYFKKRVINFAVE